MPPPRRNDENFLSDEGIAGSENVIFFAGGEKRIIGLAHMEWLGFSLVYGIALSMDALALAITDGLVYENLTKKRALFIALVFGIGQGLFPLIGYFLGEAFAQWIDRYDHWIGFALLILIGGKMLYEGFRGVFGASKNAGSGPKHAFRYSEVVIQGIADSIDALAVGLTIETAIHADVGASYEVYVACAIIAFCAFVISLGGLFFGKQINGFLKGRYAASDLLGGATLQALGVMILLEGLSII